MQTYAIKGKEMTSKADMQEEKKPIE